MRRTILLYSTACRARLSASRLGVRPQFLSRVLSAGSDIDFVHTLCRATVNPGYRQLTI